MIKPSIRSRRDEMVALVRALSWELDKLLPHPANDEESWDPVACALVRRMIQDTTTAEFATHVAWCESIGAVPDVMVSRGGDS